MRARLLRNKLLLPFKEVTYTILKPEHDVEILKEKLFLTIFLPTFSGRSRRGGAGKKKEKSEIKIFFLFFGQIYFGIIFPNYSYFTYFVYEMITSYINIVFSTSHIFMYVNLLMQ